jgi:uncharacterized protein involved in exopolysaccharide biosynthesis
MENQKEKIEEREQSIIKESPKIVERRNPYIEAVPLAPDEFEEIHLIDYVNVILKRRWLIVVGVFISVLLTGIISKRMPPVFTASAKFLPSKNPDMISRMGTLVGGGKVETFEDNVTSEYYTELLKSSPFLERIAGKKFLNRKFGGEVDLISYYKIEEGNDTLRLVKATGAISGSLKVSIDRNTKVIILSYSTNEPELSAAIVNAFVDELIIYNQDIRDTKAKQNRIFIERQLDENQKLLKKAEDELTIFTSRNKKIVTPELEVELDRLKRNVKMQEEVYITLKKQLELAKIEEQERKPSIEIIEKAAAPLYKSSPKTRRNVILAAFLSFVLFAGVAFVLEYLGKMNPADERNRLFLKYLNDIKNDFKIVNRIIRRVIKKTK